MKTEYTELRTICRSVLDGRGGLRNLNPRALATALVELVDTIETMEKTPPPAPVLAPLPDAVDAAYRFFCGLNNHVKDMSPQLGREYREHIAALGQVIKGAAWDEEATRIRKDIHAAQDRLIARRDEIRANIERQAAKVARFADGMLKGGIGARHPTLKEQVAGLAEIDGEMPSLKMGPDRTSERPEFRKGVFYNPGVHANALSHEQIEDLARKR